MYTMTAKALQKHYAIIHRKQFQEQPQGKEMAFVTNSIKRTPPERYDIKHILHALGHGHCVLPANVEIDDSNSINFISASWFAIDVDDDDMVTNPLQVLEEFKHLATGLYYTFSHGVKGNRYRIVFQFDKPVRSEDKLKIIMDLVLKQFQAKGIPADSIKNITVPIRPGIKGYVISSTDTKMDTDEWLAKAEIELKERAERIKFVATVERHAVISFEDLRKAAETIGHIPSGQGMGDVWKSIVVGIKHHANMGAISQEEGYELFDIISGGEQRPRAWDNLRASGKATIATLIHFAREKGFQFSKGYRYAAFERKRIFPVEDIKIDRYIPMEVAKNLIERRERLLVDSPTGSGKTENFIAAFQALSSKQQKYFIFAAPTRALTQQIAQKYDIHAVLGNQENQFKKVHKAKAEGKRIFVATYDMAPMLADFLTHGGQKGSFVLIVDEYHKFTTDYDQTYRQTVIDRLNETSHKASSFIGLSGTIDDVLLDDFDKVVRIRNKAKLPCGELAVYTYDKEKEASPSLVELAEAWTTYKGADRRKLLIFIQSLEEIQKVYETLRKRGIKVRKITAANKKGSAYRNLVNTETIEDDVDVVLATSVIADGININNNFKWECIVVSNRKSRMFNISTLRQMANRFRNNYMRFSLYMMEPTQQDERIFSIDAAYDYHKRAAERYADMINSEFQGNMGLFRASIIENNAGLRLEDGKATVNNLQVRYIASKQKEIYYATNRKAFVKAAEQALGKKHRYLNISKAIKKDRLDKALADFEQTESELEEQSETKKSGIEELFTRKVHQAFLDEDEELLQNFKEQVSYRHYACIKAIAGITSYSVCRKAVLQVKRDADTRKFFNHIVALVDIAHFKSYNRMTPTKKAFQEISKITGFIPCSEYKESIDKIAKRTKIKKGDVVKVKRMFVHESKRTKDERFTKSEPITIQSVAREFGLTEEEVKDSLKRYSQTQPKTVQIAVRNCYGIPL